MSTEKKNDDRNAVIAQLKETVKSGNFTGPVSLDHLIELLNADDLRNVVGMVRPKGQPGRE